VPGYKVENGFVLYGNDTDKDLPSNNGTIEKLVAHYARSFYGKGTNFVQQYFSFFDNQNFFQ
jgi:hypothetical protein